MKNTLIKLNGALLFIALFFTCLLYTSDAADD